MYYYPIEQKRLENHSEIRKEFKNKSFPNIITDDILEENGVFKVNTSIPIFNELTHKAVDIGVEFINNEWVVKWDIVLLTQSEINDKNQKLQESIVEATQQRLDDFARTRNYDGILSACTYATSTVPKFQAEGQYCVSARDTTWATLYQILAEVQAGTRPVPTSYSDIENDLPQLVWPV